MEEEWLGLRINLTNLAVSQYAHWNFNSMCRAFGGTLLGANSDGIYVVETGDDDDDEPITAFVEFPMIDLGMARIRSMHFGFEADTDPLTVSLTADEGTARDYVVAPRKVGLLSHNAKVVVGRNGRGRYWKVALSNVEGGDFSLDSIEFYPVFLGPRTSDTR